MDLLQNIPFFSILLSLFSGTVTSMVNGKWAKRINAFIITVIMAMSGVLLFYLLGTKESYTFRRPGEMKSGREFWKP